MQTREGSPNLNWLEMVAQLRTQLEGILQNAETLRAPANQSAPGTQPGRPLVAFRGQLLLEPSQAYPLLRERFATLGYTPVLRREGENEIVTAIPALFKSTTPQRWWVNLALLVLTLMTTTVMGALMEQSLLLQDNPRLFFERPALLLSGIPAALTIMGILGLHELAHYFAARRHNLDSSLPYFIPVPFGFGTFGAIIRMRTPWQDRNALFDVGIAGPLAGIIVALPIFFLGLMTAEALPPQEGGMPLGAPLLLGWMEDLVYLIRGVPPEYDLYVSAWAFAAWFGLVVSGFNLLPIGQLDGGHIAYALLGERMRMVSSVVIGALALMGLFLWPGWFVWIAFTFLSGWMHPAPLNALASLSRGRQIAGVLMLILTALIFTPAPFPGM